MENWKYLKIITKKIKLPGGLVYMKIKVGDEKEQEYSYKVGQDVRDKKIEELSYKGWIYEGSSTIDEVTTIKFKHPPEG
jgi:hypothetical protein